ncbi:hypothetical protein [[Pseudomonas] boreopolis]|uniref:hypothetical protein n=1 Tax=Xanthomonas boreopolis TaxID=86183 RepID=UPI003D3CD008
MKIEDAPEILPFQSPAEEVANFLMGFALDFDARELFEQDKAAFLKTSDLTREAQAILAEPNANTFLGKLNATEVAAAIVVLILETVTTDIIVL